MYSSKEIKLSVIGETSSPAPILVRETNEGITAINLSMENLNMDLLIKQILQHHILWQVDFIKIMNL